MVNSTNFAFGKNKIQSIQSLEHLDCSPILVSVVFLFNINFNYPKKKQFDDVIT